MRSLVIISALIAVAVALKCYQGAAGNTAGTSNTYICPGNATQCFKQVSKINGVTIELQGCDIPQALGTVCSGISNGKCSSAKNNGNSVNTCCCGNDLCNSGSFFQPLLAASILFLARFI